MELLRELIRQQKERGFLDEEVLRQLAEERCVPMYRLEELTSFYPVFRRSPPPPTIVRVCRDVPCAMSRCASRTAALREQLSERETVEFHEVSCLGRCDTAPAVAVNETVIGGTTPIDVDAVLESAQAIILIICTK